MHYEEKKGILVPVPDKPSPPEPAVKRAKDYLGHGSEFVPFESRGYNSIPVLEFLKGKPWDDAALGYVHSLRPSSIRVLRYDDGKHLDCRTWRVTVWLAKLTELIYTIDQEVELGLPEGVSTGMALQDALAYGLNSEQVRWHRDAEGYASTREGFFKTTADGKRIPYPTR